MPSYDLTVGDDLVGEMLDLAGDDLSGDDLVGDDLVGARRRIAVRRQGIARPPLINRIPGVAAPAAGKLPLGFGTVTIGAGATTGTLTARPQVPWRGQKLIIGIAGVNAGNYAVTVSPQIGNRPVLAGAAAVDARSFPADGLGNEVMAEAAQAGIDVTLNFVVTPVVAAGDSVIPSATWIGDAIV